MLLTIQTALRSTIGDKKGTKIAHAKREKMDTTTPLLKNVVQYKAVVAIAAVDDDDDDDDDANFSDKKMHSSLVQLKSSSTNVRFLGT